MASILEGGKTYRAEGLIYGIRANQASDVKEAMSWHIRNMGWKDAKFEVTKPPGSPSTEVHGVHLLNENQLTAEDKPYPIVITEGFWDKPAAALPATVHLSSGISRITFNSAQEIGGLDPTPPNPPPPRTLPPVQPPSPPQNRDILPVPAKSEANVGSFLPLVVAGGLVALMVWSWKSTPKRRNL